MQLSGRIARKIEKGNRAYFEIDFYYDKPQNELEGMLKKRRSLLSDKPSDKYLTGFTYEKISKYLTDKFLNRESTINNISDDEIIMILRWLKAAKFDIISVNGFESAQTTSGGVPMDEVTKELESKFVNGLYFAGEILDVDGLCGGYNLTWAFASAYEVSGGGK